jgi:tetrachlorobenzoquinone reductase
MVRFFPGARRSWASKVLRGRLAGRAKEGTVQTNTALSSEPVGSADEQTIDVRLVAIRFAANDTHLYELQRPDGKKLPGATPGSHIDIHLPNGMMRQYSLVNAEDSPDSYVIGIKRDVNSRGGSVYVHDKLRVGEIVKISAPRNNFPLDETAAHTILVAGGIGITPIWCMVQRLEAIGKPWQLFYSCRTRSDAAFLATLEGLASAQFNFDDENQGKYLDLAAIVAQAPPGAHLYCCGPTPMLAAFEEACKSLPPAQVHVEYFTAKHEAAAEGGFILELVKSGMELVIPPGKTILDVVRDAGVDVGYSCEQGICGACETRVISGVPDHRDSILSDSERAANKTMMICCSGCKSDRLVLDL